MLLVYYRFSVKCDDLPPVFKVKSGSAFYETRILTV